MASIIFTAKDIFDQDFKKEVRGFSKVEVNEFLDDVIKDYETYAALAKQLRVHQFLNLLQSMSFLRSLLRQTSIF